MSTRRALGHTLLRAAATATAATALTGTALLAYALHEARHPVLRRRDVPCLAPGEQPLTILHLADLHLTDRTEARVEWVRSLARLRPDVVVNTGDNLSFASGLEPLGRALEPFAGLPGAFVLGDHDYRGTVFKTPTRYLRRDPRTADHPGQGPEPDELPWQEVRGIQASHGWADLTNTRGWLTSQGRAVSLVGVDDAHADLDDYPPATNAPDAPDGTTPLRGSTGRALRLGLLHSPYRRVLDAMAGDGVDLALAGHTHGGQLCLPGVGALVTNCDLDRRRVTQRLSRWPRPATAPQDGGGMWLHVSAGLGTSPYTPVRVACPPEATLLTLLPVR